LARKNVSEYLFQVRHKTLTHQSVFMMNRCG